MRAMLLLVLPDVPVLTFSFYALVAWGLSALFVAFRAIAEERLRTAVYLRLGLLVWMGVPWFFAMDGTLSDFTATPPYLLRIVMPMFLTITIFCFSSAGRKLADKLPMTLLVGTQMFRLPLELLLHALAARAFLPQAMTFEGYNFDIVTGVLAIPVYFALHSRKAPYWLLWAWNIMGLALLITIVTLAFLSFPQPFGIFVPHNTLVAFDPWVWLPTFLVPIALASHLLIFRQLMAPPLAPHKNI